MPPAQNPAFHIATPSPEVIYLLLVFGLFVVPKLLQRFRLPGAVTSLILGVVVGLSWHSLSDDQTVHLFSTLGIVSLFLFAGLDVDFGELKQARGVLAQHLTIQLSLLALVTYLLMGTFVPAPRAALLVALAVVTPSTGFILDSLGSFGLSGREQFWIKSKAVATEIVALAVLFLVLQSRTAAQLGIATAAMAALIVALPLLFRLFAHVILPFAPKSEFAFLLIVALVCALVTRTLGVYYLVGAFLVGVVAHRFRRELPALTSDRMLNAVEVFASFFVPFYFFGAGLHVSADDLTPAAFLGAIALIGLVQPLRLLSVVLHRRMSLREDWTAATRVATPLLPTLVFTLVLAGILRSQSFDTPDWMFGALTIYAVVGTLIPGFAFGRPAPDPDLTDAAPHVAIPDADRQKTDEAAPPTPPPAPPPAPQASG